MAKEREYSFVCNDCGEEYIIITDSKDEPTLCPFCGSEDIADPESIVEQDEPDDI